MNRPPEAQRQSTTDKGRDRSTAAGSADLSDYELRRREILACAADVFYEQGFSGGTTREIAARVGLTQPAIYYYVGSKDDLLREITEQVRADTRAALGRAFSASEQPVERLRALVQEFTEAVVRNQKTFSVYWKEFKALPEELRATLMEDERAFVKEVAGIVREAQDTDALPPGPTTAMTEAILGMVTWVYQWYRPEGLLEARDLAEMFLELLGLGRDASDDVLHAAGD